MPSFIERKNSVKIQRCDYLNSNSVNKRERTSHGNFPRTLYVSHKLKVALIQLTAKNYLQGQTWDRKRPYPSRYDVVGTMCLPTERYNCKSTEKSIDLRKKKKKH